MCDWFGVRSPASRLYLLVFFILAALKRERMIWIMTMARRMNGVYAAFMLVAFMMGVAGR